MAERYCHFHACCLFLVFGAGMIHGLAEFFVDIVCCRFRLGAYRPLEVSANLVIPNIQASIW